MNRLKDFLLQALAIALTLGFLLLVAYNNTDSAGEKNPNHVVFSKDNVVAIDSEVNEASVAQALDKARKLKGCPIYLFLNTGGGEIAPGLDLIDTMKGLPCPVKTVTRYAGSMGFQFVQNLDERLMLPNGRLMSHHPRGTFSGEFGGKRPSQIEKRLALAISQWAELDAITVARTKGKQTMKSYLDAYDPEMWLTAKQAIQQGYADRIVTASCDDSLNGLVEVPTPGYSMKAFKSECPLIPGIVKTELVPPVCP